MTDHADTSKRSLFDGFEAYQTANPEDYRRALMNGVVVPDTNVLLNLYRYTTQARDDLLGVFERLGERVWAPHQVVEEFWRNRESVARALSEPVKKARKDLDGECNGAVEVVLTWANHVSAPKDRRDKMVEALRACFAELTEQIEGTLDAELAKQVLNTQSDPVLARIDALLSGRIGLPVPEKERDGLLREGKRRVDGKIPPGYMDGAKPDGRAVGDFLVWEQVLRHAEAVKRDVVFVTADAKEDWWRKGTETPRTELVEELRNRAGARLFMLRPNRLLELARSVLGADVRDESLQDVATVDRASAGTPWTSASITALLDRLERNGYVQGRVIRHAAANGGFIDRATVYRICEFDEERSLRGFTRPVRRISDSLKEQGLLVDDAVEVLEPVYESDAWTPALGFRVPTELAPLIVGAASTNVEAPPNSGAAWTQTAADTWGLKV